LIKEIIVAKKKSDSVAVVMLRSDWPGDFRRSVFGSDGNRKEFIMFEPGVPVELNQEAADAIADDIGNAIVLAEVTYDNKRKKSKVVADWNGTKEAIQSIVDRKVEAAAKAGKNPRILDHQREAYANCKPVAKKSSPARQPSMATTQDTKVSLEEL
jgi:hypothetical protein